MNCSCPRGQYKCHHVAALALHGHYNISVTDKTCSWNAPKIKSEEIKKLTDLYPPKDHRSTSRNLNEDELKAFSERLNILNGAVGFTWLTLKDVPNCEHLIAIENVIFCEEFLASDDRLHYFQEKVKVTSDTILEIANITVGQSSNANWLICKKHRLSASNFGIILSACRRNRYTSSLFKTISGL